MPALLLARFEEINPEICSGIHTTSLKEHDILVVVFGSFRRAEHAVKMGFGTDAAAPMVDTILYAFEQRTKYFTPLEMPVMTNI